MLQICIHFIIFRYDNNLVINYLTNKMETKTKNAVAPKTAAQTPQAENKTLQVIKPGTEPKAEETTAKIIGSIKPGLNLTQTLKIVEELHIKKRQRDNLAALLENLEDFEIEQKDEDLDDKSYYSGCTITLKDDARREFSTKNPAIIGEVVNFLKFKFADKLIEIEAQIVLPY